MSFFFNFILCSTVISALLVSFLSRAFGIEPLGPTSAAPKNPVTMIYTDIGPVRNPSEKIAELKVKAGGLDRQESLELAASYLLLSQPTEAAKLLHSLVSKDEKDYVAHYHLGMALTLVKKEKEAQVAFRTAIDLNNKYDSAYARVAALLNEKLKRQKPGTKNSFYELRILYADWMANTSESPVLLERNCFYLTQSGLFDEAKPICEKSSRASPGDAAPRIQLAIINRDPNNLKQYVDKLIEIASQFPQSAEAQSAAAMELEAAKDSLRAVTFYQKAYSIDARNIFVIGGLAKNKIAIGEVDEALTLYRSACKFTRALVSDMRKAASALRIGKNTEGARKYEDAVENCTPPRPTDTPISESDKNSR